MENWQEKKSLKYPLTKLTHFTPLNINSDGIFLGHPLQTAHLSIPNSFNIKGTFWLCPKVSAKYPIKSLHPKSLEIFIPISKFFLKLTPSVKNSSINV